VSAKDILGTFELTVPQQRVIVALLLVFVFAFAAKKYHERVVDTRASAALVQPSPSPGTRP
jgi:predicted transporter